MSGSGRELGLKTKIGWLYEHLAYDNGVNGAVEVIVGVVDDEEDDVDIDIVDEMRQGSVP